MKRDKVDKVFSDLIRMRPAPHGYVCERCSRYYPEGHRGGLDCSHFFSRVNTRGFLRWHPWNAAAHCRGCHQYLGDNPIMFDQWIQEYLGEERYARVRELYHSGERVKPAMKEDLYAYLKEQLKIMVEARNEGFVGRLEFEPYASP